MESEDEKNITRNSECDRGRWRTDARKKLINMTAHTKTRKPSIIILGGVT